MKRFLTGLLALSIIFSLASCTGKNSSTEGDANLNDKHSKIDSPYSVIDFAGRQVEFDKVPETVITIGHGVLKTYVYMCGSDNLIGIEKAEISDSNLNGQSIHHAYPDLKDIQVVGNGGPKFSPDYELLSYLNPDVIFCAYNISPEEYDKLQEKTKSRVIALDMGTARKVFYEPVYQNFEIIGKVMDRSDRAEELISYIKKTEEDLKSRDLSIDDSPNTYIGGCTFKGEQGILSTKADFELLKLAGIRNIMDELTDESSIIIDKEKLTELNPELILFDLSGKKLIMEDIEKDPVFYDHLDAFKNGKVYTIMPYFTYGMNFDTAILDMYYIASLVHPDKFQDISLDEVAEKAYSTFVGKDVYKDLIEYYPETFKEFKL